MKIRHVAILLFVCLAAVLLSSAPASAQTGEWTACASEGSVCAFSGTQQVRYGANGSYVYRSFSNGIFCSNVVFGDPAPGAAKQCAVGGELASTDWSICAVEGSTCAFHGTQQVRYGANGSYVYRSFSDGIFCSNIVFGDPAPGAAKLCAVGGGSSSTTSWSVCASEGSLCSFGGTQQVRYGANGSYVYRTLSDGIFCSNAVFGDPAPGAAKQCSIGGTASAATPAPPPPPAPTFTSGYGPRSSITCPSGAADIWPGMSIQGVVNNNPAGTTYCLRAGIHSVSSSVTPKRGDTFVGEYGAVLDGGGWRTSDDTQGAFRAHNQDIDYVTIRNLVIRNMPQKGIHAYYWMSDHWTIEFNEIAYNKWGLEFAPDFTIRNNYIHHNVGNPSSSVPADRGGGYVGGSAHNTTFDSNEIAYNGPEQKVVQSANVTFGNNFVHHNQRDGIWFDSNTAGGVLIDGNRVEDNGRNGISFEASIGAHIQNNTVRRNAGDGIFVSMSQSAQIHGNWLEGNVGGIEYFLYCGALSLGEDVRNNAAYSNTVIVGTQAYAYASAFSSTACSSGQLGPYMNGSKNLSFFRNTYKVPSANGQYLIWGGWKYWNEWQALGYDVDGSLSQ